MRTLLIVKSLAFGQELLNTIQEKDMKRPTSAALLSYDGLSQYRLAASRIMQSYSISLAT